MSGEREIVSLALTRGERRELADLAHEYAGRLGRESGAGAKKRGERWSALAREISPLASDAAADGSIV
jgi:hypothetical protein